MWILPCRGFRTSGCLIRFLHKPGCQWHLQVLAYTGCVASTLGGGSCPVFAGKKAPEARSFGSKSQSLARHRLQIGPNPSRLLWPARIRKSKTEVYEFRLREERLLRLLHSAAGQSSLMIEAANDRGCGHTALVPAAPVRPTSVPKVLRAFKTCLAMRFPSFEQNGFPGSDICKKINFSGIAQRVRVSLKVIAPELLRQPRHASRESGVHQS